MSMYNTRFFDALISKMKLIFFDFFFKVNISLLLKSSNCYIFTRSARFALFASMNDSEPPVNSDKQTRPSKKFFRLSCAEIEQFVHWITVNYTGDCVPCNIKQIFIQICNERAIYLIDAYNNYIILEIVIMSKVKQSNFSIISSIYL